MNWMKSIIVKMKANRAITIAAVVLFVVTPSPFTVLRAADEQTLVVVAGSIYLLGEVRPLLTDEPFCTIVEAEAAPKMPFQGVRAGDDNEGKL